VIICESATDFSDILSDYSKLHFETMLMGTCWHDDPNVLVPDAVALHRADGAAERWNDGV
jgi:hypothetical protein